MMYPCSCSNRMKESRLRGGGDENSLPVPLRLPKGTVRMATYQVGYGHRKWIQNYLCNWSPKIYDFNIFKIKSTCLYCDRSPKTFKVFKKKEKKNYPCIVRPTIFM